MTMRFRVVPLAFAAVAGCSSGGTDNNNGGGGNAAFSATIDGANWASLSTSAAAQISGAGNFAIVGGNAAGTSVSLTLYNIRAPGTYPLGVSGLVYGGTATVSAGAGAWSTPLSGTAGTVTLTAVSATHIAGTFSFAATPLFGSAANKNVTSGSFDLPVTGSGTMTVPDQKGSKVSGTLQGASWNSATVVMVSAPSSGTLAVGIGNNLYNINLIISGFNGVGTYAMGTATAAVSRYLSIATLDGTNKTWGYSNASTTGTFVVTSSTSKRMTGTYNFTVAPFGSTTTGNFTMSGTFDIGLEQFGT